MSNKCTHKGALFIEYALILAFILITGSVFVSSGDLSNGIGSIFGTTSNTLDKAASKSKTVAEKNTNFVQMLAAYLKENGTKDSATKPFYGYNDDKHAKLQYATDSEWGGKTDCFGIRWKKAMGDKEYAAMVDNLSYAFYGNKNAQGQLVWDVYVYNPESNNGKLLSEYDKNFILSSDNKINTEHYTINNVTGEIQNLGTEVKAVTSHNYGSRYNVIRDIGAYE